jgi:hypothetical protein
MYDKSIACYRDLSPAVPPVPGHEKKAHREAVIGRYPDVLVPNEPPAERLLQGDDLPGRCRFFVDFPIGDLPTWPNNGCKTATYSPAARPLTRGLEAGGRWPDHPSGWPAGRHAAERDFCNDKCHCWQGQGPPSLKRGISAGRKRRPAPTGGPPSGGPPPAGDIGPGAPVLVPLRRMREGPVLLEVRQHVLRCAARAAGPTPRPGPTAWAYRIGRAQAPTRRPAPRGTEASKGGSAHDGWFAIEGARGFR